MRVLSDLEVLALLAVAPMDEGAVASPGHVSLFERVRANDLRALAGDGLAPPNDLMWMRRVFARVFGLPERDGAEPIVMSLAWGSDAKETP